MNAAILSASIPLPQKRSRERRTYQFDSSSTNPESARAASGIMYAASSESTFFTMVFILERMKRSIVESSQSLRLYFVGSKLSMSA